MQTNTFNCYDRNRMPTKAECLECMGCWGHEIADLKLKNQQLAARNNHLEHQLVVWRRKIQRVMTGSLAVVISVCSISANMPDMPRRYRTRNTRRNERRIKHQYSELCTKDEEKIYELG